MAWSTALEELLPDTVKIRTWSGVSTDGYGTATYTTSTGTFKARISLQQKEVRTFEGVDELATTTVWVATSSTFGPSTVLIRSTSTASLGNVLAVESPPDEDGRHHVKVYLG